MDKETTKAEIAKLIDEFEKNRDYYEKTDEANIETKLIEPMFAALGWTKDDFEKREKIKRKDRRGITDYTFKLRGKSVFVLEAKKVKVEVDWDEGTWKQAISYTFSKKVSFSVLTNFKNLLIFCTDDERAMRPFRQLKYTEYLPSRFEDLWLLSKDSFEQNLINERAASEGRMKKRRTIDDELLEGLLSSRKKIVESIEQNYGGKYTTLEKDDIAQRIFGRLIFMRKCEDKQINFDKDGKEIEMLKEVTALPHNEAYPKLKKIFTKYNDVFDSGLFMKEADSDADKIEIDGKVIKELVNSTYESKDGNYVYNFEWIDADILGNIYEQYLGHILKETTKQTRIKESHAHRKERGVYYTPTEIVKYIVNNTLGEILKEKKPEEIKKLRVLDPACGSGSFLIKAFDVLEDYYEKNGKATQQKFDSSGDFYSIKEQVLINNIFGVDLDHKAIEIAQLNLLLKLAEKGHRLPLLQKNIQNGNSLIDDEVIAGDKAFNWKQRFKQIMDEGGFDVIIGNPPYVRPHKISKADKQYLWKNFKTFRAKSDLYNCFMEKGINLLREDGLFSFIVPHTWVSLESFYEIRKLILDSCRVLRLVQLPKKVFKQATVETTIFVLRKESEQKKREENQITVERLDENGTVGFVKKFIQSQIRKNHLYNFELYSEKPANEILKKIKNTGEKLGGIVDFFYGLKTGDDNKFISGVRKTPEHKKLLRSKDIGRYSKKFENEYVWYKPDLMTQNKKTARPGTAERFESDKVIVARMGKQVAAFYDDDNFYVKDGMLLLRKNKSTNLRYITGILNSKLINFYYKNYFITIDVLKNALLELPIASVDESVETHVAKLVQKMEEINKRLNELGDKNTPETARLKEEIQKTDQEIDELVYELYGITEEEKKAIEESLK